MIIEYDGDKLEFDLEDITLSQATYIHKHLGLTLQGLDRGLMEGHPDALRAVWWLIQSQSGQKVNIDNVDFKIVKLSNAIQDAYEREQQAKNPEAAAEAADPKDAEPEDQTLTQ